MRQTVAMIVAAADQVIAVWSAHPEFTLETATLRELQALHAELRTVVAEIGRVTDATTELRNRRDATLVRLNAACVRMRSALRGNFGVDSAEYRLAGGGRRRARPVNRPPAPRPAASA